jgi:hypothetical protein
LENIFLKGKLRHRFIDLIANCKIPVRTTPFPAYKEEEVSEQCHDVNCMTPWKRAAGVMKEKLKERRAKTPSLISKRHFAYCTAFLFTSWSNVEFWWHFRNCQI